MVTLRVGVLALQGSFAEHVFSLEKGLQQAKGEFPNCTLDVTLVRRPEDLSSLNGLIIPGGESTTMAKFLEKNNFQEVLISYVRGKQANGHPRPIIWGTCAGLILLADRLQETKTGGQLTIGGINITATRNKYGRQFESFENTLDLKSSSLIGEGPKHYHGIFIRAPGVTSVDGDEVEVLATYEKDGTDRVVAVRQGPLIASAFHPELTDDHRWHLYFLRAIKEAFGGNP